MLIDLEVIKTLKYYSKQYWSGGTPNAQIVLGFK